MIKGAQLCVTQKAMPQPIMPSANTKLSMCWPEKLTGAPWNNLNLYLPDNLPKAITEPEKVIAPTKVPINNSTRFPIGIKPPASVKLNAQGSDTTATAIQTAAKPMSECIAATNSGILVISTRFAKNAPIAPPTTTPPTTKYKPMPELAKCDFNDNIIAIVVTTAIAMPTMPKVLPRRAVEGWDKPLSAWIKQTEAIKYSITTRLRLIICPPY